jgi:glycosyltransferase involved in cell wall biosynthesis
MRILINALSVSNTSGRHVLLGHLRNFAPRTEGRHEYMVLYNRANKDIVGEFAKNVSWYPCSSSTMEWKARMVWETLQLPSVVRAARADAVFNPAGIVYSGLNVPQISFAQNPWCFVPEARDGWKEHLKAFLQRHAYRRAMKIASAMVFNSEFMRQAYRENARLREKRSYVIHQGVDDTTFCAAEKMRKVVERKDFQVLCVSVMARHKGVETVVEALRLLRNEKGIPAKLVLVGGWPDSKYESFIRNKVAQWGLQNFVDFRGHVPKEELHRAYAESKVFCLMSRCESFGIPGIEAQAFGTPVISSNCCAIPEICGAAGLYTDPEDAPDVAEKLALLMSSQKAWKDASLKGLANVERFRWRKCSRKFGMVFDSLADLERLKS